MTPKTHQKWPVIHLQKPANMTIKEAVDFLQQRRYILIDRKFLIGDDYEAVFILPPALAQEWVNRFLV